MAPEAGHPPDTGRPSAVVLRALGLGDLLTGVPALRGLRAGFPDHLVTLLAPRAFVPLLELAGPIVDEVVDVDFRHRVGTLDAGRLEEPDLAVNLHGRGPRSHAVLRRLRPRRLLAFADPVSDHDGPAWHRGEHEVHRWCRLLVEEGVPADPSALGLRPPALAHPIVTRGATLLHPGAASPARRWPEERWVELAHAEHAAGRAVVLTGDASERDRALQIAGAAGLPREAVLAGRTDLTGLAAVVAAAGLVVSGDTGLAHLATALSRPSVVLFGPTPPAEWGPPPQGPHVALWAGRRGDPHAQAPDPGLLAIPVARVQAAMARLRSDGLAA